MKGKIVTFDSPKAKNLKMYVDNEKTLERIQRTFSNVRISDFDEKKYKLSYGYDRVDGSTQYTLAKRK